MVIKELGGAATGSAVPFTAQHRAIDGELYRGSQRERISSSKRYYATRGVLLYIEKREREKDPFLFNDQIVKV